MLKRPRNFSADHASLRLVLPVPETSCIRMVYQVVIFGNTTEKLKPSVSLCLNYTCVETGRDKTRRELARLCGP